MLKYCLPPRTCPKNSGPWTTPLRKRICYQREKSSVQYGGCRQSPRLKARLKALGLQMRKLLLCSHVYVSSILFQAWNIYSICSYLQQCVLHIFAHAYVFNCMLVVCMCLDMSRHPEGVCMPTWDCQTSVNKLCAWVCVV